MIGRRTRSWTVGILVAGGLGLATWMVPSPAHAGGVRLSIGIGIPAPVYVVPPPVVVHQAPGIVYPGVVYPPPVVYRGPYGAYAYPPPVIVKKHRHHRHHHHYAHGYKFYKHGKRGW